MSTDEETADMPTAEHTEYAQKIKTIKRHIALCAFFASPYVRQAFIAFTLYFLIAIFDEFFGSIVYIGVGAFPFFLFGLVRMVQVVLEIR